MNGQILVGLTSSLLGGAIVALIAYVSTRKRTEAEARKLDAETERTKAETTKMLSEMQAAYPARTPGGTAPNGWGLDGHYMDDYEVGTDTAVAHSGSRSAFLVSRPEPGPGCRSTTCRTGRSSARRTGDSTA